MCDGEHGGQRLTGTRLIESHSAASSCKYAQASAVGLRAVMYRHTRAHAWREPKHEDTGAHHEDLTHSCIVGRSWKNIPAKTAIGKRCHWPVLLQEWLVIC